MSDRSCPDARVRTRLDPAHRSCLMQPIAGAFRHPGVVRARVRRRRTFGATVVMMAVTLTVLAGFDAESRGSASTADN